MKRVIHFIREIIYATFFLSFRCEAMLPIIVKESSWQLVGIWFR